MTWIGSIRVTLETMANQDTAAERSDIPDFLRPLHDDWFGETSAPLIFRAVNLESWEICRRLLAEIDNADIRENLKHIDMYGYSALHYACWWRSAPLDIVTQLVDNSPSEYPAQRNRKGRTPLHLASWRGRDEVVQLLARKCPHAASVTDKNEKSALSDACSRNRSKPVLEALIEADSSQIVNRNSQGRTPAHTFFRISHGHVTKPSGTRFTNEEEQLEYKEKVRLILSTERRIQEKPELDLGEEPELLCAAIESPSCSFSYVKCLLDQIDSKKVESYRDGSGSTLMHIALQADRFEFESFYNCDRCSGLQEKMYFNRNPGRAHWGVRCTACSIPRQTVMIHYVQIAVVDKLAAIINYLTTKHPSLARIRDSAGKLPLETALRTGNCEWSMGVNGLVKAYPKSLLTPEKSSGLYPFLLTATLGSEDRDNDGDQPPRKKRKMIDGASFDSAPSPSRRAIVETTYLLLRECPDLIKMATP